MGQIRVGERSAEDTPEVSQPYIARPRRRRRRQPEPRPTPRSRLRPVFFAIASLWGFVVGTVTIVGFLSLTGRSIQLDARTGTLLGIAAVLALVGGMVASAAYRDAVERGTK